MAVLVMANVCWRMACTDVPAPTAGPAPTALSLSNSLAMTTKTMMKVSASLLQPNRYKTNTKLNFDEKKKKN